MSLADPRFVANLPTRLIGWAQRRSAETGLLATPIARTFRFAVQVAEERRAERARRALLAAQDQRDLLLALYGKSA